MHFTFKLRDQLEGNAPSTFNKGGGSGGSSSGTYGPGMTPAESDALATVSGGSPMPKVAAPITSKPYVGAALGTSNPYQQASMAQQGALAGTVAAGMYQPQQVQTQFNAPMVGTSGAVPVVGTGGTTPSVAAGQLSGTNIAAYQNPYTQQVIDAQNADIMRGAQMGLNELGAQASAAGAFGGSRHGVAMSELGRGVAQLMGQQSAQLRQAAFQNAQQAAQFDIGQGMQAQQLNQQAAANDLARRLQAQGMNQTAAMQTAQRQLQANLANQSAIQGAQQLGLGAQQFNVTSGLQGAQQGLQAAQQLANLGQQSFGYGQTINQGLAQQGAQQQALQQALIDAAKAQYAGYQGQPASSLGYASAALGATPIAMQTQQTKQLGLMDYLTAGATLGQMSDVRLKTNIKITGKLKNGLNTYSWDWNEKGQELTGQKSNSGVIAQEVAEMFPEAVLTGEHGYMMVDYGHPELAGAI